MADLVIKAENISKQYRLGKTGTGSLRQDIAWWWQSRVLKKRIDFFDGHLTGNEAEKPDQIWALKDISFELHQGEALGIVGRNGAGKSTLLKVMSRIIKPTTGTIKGNGRISSLLEIGTGFHQELSGRENIFISGYILGMRKAEIQKKFDEIVEFSGVAKFLDTPVKRYSSGMYVRLAFAVAAHLEPDILIVDEVLAVGDAEFQKKCMGKMKDASTQSGRTIIFVSHNMQAINSLCSNAIWLDKGRMIAQGPAQEIVNAYLSSTHNRLWRQEWPETSLPGNELIQVSMIEMTPIDPPVAGVIDIRTGFKVRFRFYNHFAQARLVTELLLFTASGECIFVVANDPTDTQPGWLEGECEIPGFFLNDGAYYFSLAFIGNDRSTLFYLEECLFFNVEDYSEIKDWYVKWWGYVRPKFPFKLEQLSLTGIA